MISYIVSSCNRPGMLTACLASLYVQTGLQDSEIIVCDNSDHPQSRIEVEADAAWFGARYLNTGALSPAIGVTCYHDTSYTEPRGEWLCFPSDDSYYVPHFTRIMLAAAEANCWELVFCDVLYDPRLAFDTRGIQDMYSILDTQPRLGGIDKTSFIITRAAFDSIGGWPQHEAGWRDGALAQAVVDAGIPHGKAPGVMLVHN